LKIVVMVEGANTLKAVDQSQHADRANQSEQAELFRRRGFIEALNRAF